MKNTRLYLKNRNMDASSRRPLRQWGLLIFMLLSPLLSWAMDPPHSTNNCASCHMTHNSLGSSLTSVAGNANLCESCHISGGSASFHPFSDSDQALPFPGLFSNVTQRGSSHRWDSGVAGHIVILGGAPVASTGTILSSGVYTGAYPKAYAIVMVTSGNVGVARFNWSTSLGIGGGTNVLTGTNVPLNEGITVTFANGAGTSFQVGDQWNVYVRTDIRSPTNSALVTDVNGQVTCSTCHDVHSQAYPAFDNTNSTVAVATASYETFDANWPTFGGYSNVVVNPVTGWSINRAQLQTTPFTNTPPYLCILEFSAANTNTACARSPWLTNGVAFISFYARASSATPSIPLTLAIETSYDAGTSWVTHATLSFTNNLAGWRTNTFILGSPESTNNQFIQLRPISTNTFSFSIDTISVVYPTNGTPVAATGQHYLAMSNNTEQMCVDCHAARTVTNSISGSHPVGVSISTGLFYKTSSVLPMERGTGKMGCMTCHKVHYAPSLDGDLVRMTNGVAMCVECHLLADTLTPAAHFSATNPLTLWPGGQYGTTFPKRTNATDQGTCVNCHHPHGWPVSTNTATHYPKLLLDLEEAVCFTCHDTNGPALKRTQGDFSKAIRHPIGDNDPLRRAGRSVECNDCHNAHRATPGASVYANTATSARSQVTNPIQGVSGVTFNYGGLANFQAVATNLYTLIPKPNGATNSPGATNEWQICFKCHSGYAWPGGSPPNGISTNGTAISPIETDLAQEFSPMNRSGHPVVTGLNNYPNSIVVGGQKGLLTGALKAPWNVNIGSQTMTCTDCHNTDAASPAAQGPHGSAVQFMLRTFAGGSSPTNWPNVSSFSSSWCANCHIDNVSGSTHSRSEHTSARCYGCHIVIPHGGKVSRLIALSGGTMPARYAYNNNVATVGMTSILKAAASGYTENGNCRTSCGHHGSGPINETW